MSRRPTRPLPSRNGWMVSNCTWASAAFTSAPVQRGRAGSARARPCTAPPAAAAAARRGRCPDACRRSSSGCGGTRPAACRLRARARAEPVDLADEPVREREAVGQTAEAVLQRSHVVGDLDHVVEGHAGRLVQLEEQQVREGGLRALDLGGEHCLLAHVGVEEERRVRQQRGDAVQPAAREEERLSPAPLTTEGPISSGGCGGSGAGTKARTSPLPTEVISYLPAVPLCTVASHLCSRK